MVQACLGAISENFLGVILGRYSGGWKVIVYLKEESVVDREEVDDICREFLVLDLDDDGCIGEVHVGEELPRMLPPPSRFIYMKKIDE